MNSGIEVEMKYNVLQFIFMFFKTQIAIDGVDSGPKKWGKTYFAVPPGRHAVWGTVKYLFWTNAMANELVVDVPSDLAEIAAYLAAWPQVPGERVWLMPQARTSEELLARSVWLEAEALRLGYRFSSRWQIAEFGNQRGK